MGEAKPTTAVTIEYPIARHRVLTRLFRAALVCAGFASGEGCTNYTESQVTTHGPDYFNQWYNKVWATRLIAGYRLQGLHILDCPATNAVH